MPLVEKLPLFLTLLIGAVLVASCASRPQPVTEREKEREQESPSKTHSPPPAALPSRLESLAERVKNGQGIDKYFTLDADGQIAVMANVQSDDEHYTIHYNLADAEVLADSAYSVRFLISGIDSDTSIEDTLVWKPGPGNSGILLSMDDAFMENWERYFDLFDAYGARLTFFIQGGYTPFGNKALSRGHDIGYHSLNHRDLRKISRNEFTQETIEPLEAFRSRGVPLSAFAFPFGFSDQWMRETLLGSFSVLRGYGTTFRLYHADEIRSGYIISRAIDNIVIRDEDAFCRLIALMLRAVKFLDDDRILPLTSHEISDADWGITPRRLEFVLKTASELNLHFYRFSDF